MALIEVFGQIVNLEKISRLWRVGGEVFMEVDSVVTCLAQGVQPKEWDEVREQILRFEQ